MTRQFPLSALRLSPRSRIRLCWAGLLLAVTVFSAGCAKTNTPSSAAPPADQAAAQQQSAQAAAAAAKAQGEAAAKAAAQKSQPGAPH